MRYAVLSLLILASCSRVWIIETTRHGGVIGAQRTKANDPAVRALAREICEGPFEVVRNRIASGGVTSSQAIGGVTLYDRATWREITIACTGF